MKCEDCVYYHPFKHPNSAGKGKCRRYPPIPLVKPALNGSGYSSVSFVHTETQEDWWCGEYATDLPEQRKAVDELQEWTDDEQLDTDQ